MQKYRERDKNITSVTLNVVDRKYSRAVVSRKNTVLTQCNRRKRPIFVQSDLSNLILSNLIIIKNLSNLIKNSDPIWADLIVNLINKIL